MAEDDRKTPIRRKRRKTRWIAFAVLLGIGLVAWFAEFEYAYLPDEDAVLNPQRINEHLVCDHWGRSLTAEEAEGASISPAHHRRFRYRTGERPSQFFAAVNPTPWAAGFNEMVAAPTFPKGSLISPDGLFISKPGRRVWELNNAISAFQNSLAPPVPDGLDPTQIARGAEVFETAGCRDCHDGPGYTNHRIVPAAEIGTESSRATALANLEQAMVFEQPAGAGRSRSARTSGRSQRWIAARGLDEGKRCRTRLLGGRGERVFE